jgi:hypothetical protein
MKKFIGVVLSLCFVFGLVGSAFGLSAYRDELINGMWTFENNVTFLGDIAGGGSLTLNGVEYTWPAADGTATYQLTTDGAGTLSWAAAGAGCPWDDLLPPDTNESLDHTVYWTAWDFGDTDHDMFTITGSDDFGDVSVVKIEQSTGDPTDGTVLEVVSADTDADALVITANSINGIVVAGDGDVSLTGGTGVINYTDFDVSADGAVTITSDTDNTMLTLNPSIATTLAIDATAANIVTALSVGANDIIGTTGLINYTNFDVDAAGNVSAVDGTFTGDVIVTGTIKQDALVPASAAPQTITIDGAGAGGVTIGATSTGNVTLGDDVVVSDTYDVLIGEGKLTIDDDANETALVITSDVTDGTSAQITSTVTDGKGLSIIGDSLTGGSLLYLDATEGAGFTGYYILAYDSSANDFAVKRHGEVEITGAAGDMLTITTGDIQLTSGDIDMDDGIITITNDADESNQIIRDYAGAGSAAALYVSDDNTSSTNIALDINQDGTGASTGVRIVHDGTNPILDLDAGAARNGDAIDIAMANMLDERALNITGAITAAAGEGTIEVHSTGQVAATGSLLRLDNDTAQAADASSGYMLNIDDDTLIATTPVVYAALIDSNANGALHVSKGVSLFADAVTFTAASVHNGGLTVAEDIDIDFDNADEEINLTNSAEMDDGLAQVTIYNSDADLTDGDLAANMYLLRLMYKDQADPDGAFLSCEDNDGDEQFIIDAEGATTMEGTLTVNGPQIVGDGATEMVGVIHDAVVSSGGTVAVTAAESGTIFYNDQAVEFDLPADPTGLEFTFVVAHASNVHLDPNVNDVFSYIGCAAGDRLLSSTVGDTITIVGISATAWYVKSVSAGDGDFTDTVWTDAD